MEKMQFGKKQYLILLALSAITFFLLPVACGIFSVVAFLKNPAGTSGTATNIVLYIVAVSGYAGDAVLVFTAIRYRFKQCLPLAFAAVLTAITGLILELVENSVVKTGAIPIAYGIITMLISCALPFAFIGIAKVSAKHLKKEAAAVLVTFLGMIIVNLLTIILSGELNLLLVKIPGGFAVRHYDIFGHLAGSGLRLLRNYLFVAAVYLVLKFVFTSNRRDKFRAAFSKVKNITKKGSAEASK